MFHHAFVLCVQGNIAEQEAMRFWCKPNLRSTAEYPTDFSVGLMSSLLWASGTPVHKEESTQMPGAHETSEVWLNQWQLHIHFTLFHPLSCLLENLHAAQDLRPGGCKGTI